LRTGIEDLIQITGGSGRRKSPQRTCALRLKIVRRTSHCRQLALNDLSRGPSS
jgi:hypothetical protein